MAFSLPQPTPTFYCSQKIQAMPSLCCFQWSCLVTHGRGSRSHDFRYHGFHCHAILFHSRWTRCSSSPHPLRGATESAQSCECCVATQRGPGHCCHCPLKVGRGQLQLGCSRSSGGAVPLICTPRPPSGWSCLKWMLCTPKLHPGPPAPGSNKVWSLNLLTSFGDLPWALPGYLTG